MPSILGTSSWLPEQIIPNSYFNGTDTGFDQSRAGKTLDEWITYHYGITNRRWSDILPSDMASKCCLSAIANSGLKVAEMDFLILNTAIGDYLQPTTATQVQKKINMSQNSFALELNMPCAGPIFSLAIAQSFLLTGKYNQGLVVGTDKMTDLIDNHDFRMITLFGEGAGACVVGKRKGLKIVDYTLHSAGEEGDEDDFALCIPGGKAAHPARHPSFDNSLLQLRMNGKKTETLIRKTICNSVQQLMNSHNLKASDIRFFVTHQAARRPVLEAAHAVGFRTEQVWLTIEEYGNTSSASIFITLSNLLEKNRLNPGDMIILSGTGGGLNWGAMLLEKES